MENAMHFFDLPLLDVVGVGIRQPEQPFGEMADDRMLMQELLVVEFLW